MLVLQGIIYSLLDKKKEADEQFETYRSLVPQEFPQRGFLDDVMIAAKTESREQLRRILTQNSPPIERNQLRPCNNDWQQQVSLSELVTCNLTRAQLLRKCSSFHETTEKVKAFCLFRMSLLTYTQRFSPPSKNILGISCWI